MDKNSGRLVKRQVKLEMSARRHEASQQRQQHQKYNQRPHAGRGGAVGGSGPRQPRSRLVPSLADDDDVVLVDAAEIPSYDSDGSDDGVARGRGSSGGRSGLTTSHPITSHKQNISTEVTAEASDQDNTSGPARKLARSANHLLNFTYAPREKNVPRDPIPRRRGNIQTLPFKRERFLQANYRFVVSPDEDFSENMTDADSIIEWDAVEQVIYPTPIEYECVICLFPPTCAKIAKCGHVFCHSCILRYFTYLQKGTSSMACPICLQERIYLKDLKSVQFMHVPKYQVGDAINFDLVKRPKHLNCLTVCDESSASASDPASSALSLILEGELPILGDRHSVFNRLVVTYDIGEIVKREEAELADAIKLADSSREDSLPFLIASQEDLAARTAKLAPVVERQHQMYAQRIAEHLTLARKPLPPTEEDYYFFYQASDGQHLFLHPINVKWMVTEFGSHSKFPYQLDTRILDMEDQTQSEQSRKRFKYLGHLPISCDFKFVLVELDHVLTGERLAGFKADVKARSEQISQKQAEQDRRMAKTAKKPTDPYRAAQLHFAPPSMIPEELDISSNDAFPSVNILSSVVPTPGTTVEATEEPVVRSPPTAWSSGPSTRVKAVVEDFPALSSSPGSSAFPSLSSSSSSANKPATTPVWGAKAAAAAAPKEQPKPAPQPNSADASSSHQGKKKKKTTILLLSNSTQRTGH